jgi:hypothetical protein
MAHDSSDHEMQETPEQELSMKSNAKNVSGTDHLHRMLVEQVDVTCLCLLSASPHDRSHRWKVLSPVCVCREQLQIHLPMLP